MVRKMSVICVFHDRIYVYLCQTPEVQAHHHSGPNVSGMWQTLQEALPLQDSHGVQAWGRGCRGQGQ